MIMIKLSLLYDSMVLKHIEISQKKKKKVCKRIRLQTSPSRRVQTLAQAGYYGRVLYNPIKLDYSAAYLAA